MPRGLAIAFFCLALPACNSSTYLGDLYQPTPMLGPKGISNDLPKQDTPELQARADAEREDLPQPPPPPPVDNYYPLGLVPLERPKMPTIAEIAGATKELQDEMDRQAAKIAVQAGAPLPDTLPKPNANGTPPAAAAPPPAADAGNQVFSLDQQIFLPQSQTVESTDLMPPAMR
jgi:hypothetical protein